MSLVRLASLTLLLGLGFTLAPTTSPARQDDKDPVLRKPSGYSDVSRFKSASTLTSNGSSCRE